MRQDAAVDPTMSASDEASRADPADEVERVWREQGSKLWRSLTAFTGDAELASDSMAEAFAQALGRGAELRHTDRWIWRSAFAIAKGELQQLRRAQDTRVMHPAASSMPESVGDLVAALKTLSPNQRMAVILVLYADLPSREAARVIGCSPTTVRVHLGQARRRLRPLLEDRDD
jgi:RNA polymerase sigma-70 factor (ECF subfamily)